jgi:hypothetical protein
MMEKMNIRQNVTMRIPILLLFIIIVGVLMSGCGLLDSGASDQATLDALLEAGSDLSKVHPFDFYFYHDEQLGAQQLCAALRDQGFQVSVRSGAIEGEWLCLASQNMVPSNDRLTKLSSVFNELIDQYGGEYDGWETIVIP